VVAAAAAGGLAAGWALLGQRAVPIAERARERYWLWARRSLQAGRLTLALPAGTPPSMRRLVEACL
jgi:hypothetical protein